MFPIPGGTWGEGKIGAHIYLFLSGLPFPWVPAVFDLPILFISATMPPWGHLPF